MNKIINPCTVENKQAYCRIYTEEKLCNLLDGTVDTITVLHITGVVGPRSNGDAYSAGQCYDTLRQGVANAGWTADSLYKLLDIWERWHMNDMNGMKPYCEHQVGEAWNPDRQVKVYKYKMSVALLNEQNRLKKNVEEKLSAGAVVQLKEPQLSLYNKPYFVKYYNSTSPAGYEKYSEETKPVGSLYPMDSDTTWGDKHPLGILCKPCPICGYKWGSSWRAERIPAEVLTWLESLPDSTRTPAWV